MSDAQPQPLGSPGANPVLNVLRTNVSNESQDIHVETINMSASSFDGSMARFRLPKKGTVMDSNSHLVFKSYHDTFDVNKYSASYPRFCGALAAIQTCRLYFGGKLIQELREAGRKLAADHIHNPYEVKEYITDVMYADNSRYNLHTSTTLAQVGLIALENDSDGQTPGARHLDKTSTGKTVEALIPLSSMFSMLKDVQLPVSHMNQEVVIEIDFNTNFTEVMIEDGSQVWSATERSFSIANPRLLLDFIHYSNEVNAELSNTIQQQGISYLYREETLVKKNTGAGTNGQTQTVDLELGFSGRQVMKINAAKLHATKNPNNFLHKFRSDMLNGEKYNLLVNNHLLYDKDVELSAEQYAYLSETANRPATMLPGMYEIRGVQGGANSANNFIYDSVLNGTVTAKTGLEANVQGAKNYIGFNLAKSRKADDSPANSIRIGSSPIIYRLTRTSDAADVEVNIWVSWVRSAILKGGEVNVVDF